MQQFANLGLSETLTKSYKSASVRTELAAIGELGERIVRRDKARARVGEIHARDEVLYILTVRIRSKAEDKPLPWPARLLLYYKHQCSTLENNRSTRD